MRTFIYILFSGVLTMWSCSENTERSLEMHNLYPWCIVAFDSLDRNPDDRIKMLNELGFSKYAYDWREDDLDEMQYELNLAKENNIEIISVWLWLNAKRDSLNKLSASNERIFRILKDLQLNTSLWLSFNNNFFDNLSQEQAMTRARDMIEFIYDKAAEMNCEIALYNHSGWFGDYKNQLELIKSMPQCSLKIVYNFHHSHKYLDDFPETLKQIKPYLSYVNLNGMKKEGPKILPLGEGDHESEMINLLINEGFTGSWGILGHVEDDDVRKVLERNLRGLDSLLEAGEIK